MPGIVLSVFYNMISLNLVNTLLVTQSSELGSRHITGHLKFPNKVHKCTSVMAPDGDPPFAGEVHNTCTMSLYY